MGCVFGFNLTVFYFVGCAVSLSVFSRVCFASGFLAIVLAVVCLFVLVGI